VETASLLWARSGVPWTYAEGVGLHLALKSGNFGARDFFLKAFGV
jgi:uncharacterized protein YgbK (DUF1537 family)